ncbi:MAG: hydrolase [Parcubacteria group bacterium Greene0714_36]|nr:MAG: hydrolase [Parcubacteria group bacterium Greene0714_36]
MRYNGDMRILAHGSILNINLSGAPLAEAGRVVLLLHGWGRSLDDFGDLASRLASAFPDTAFLSMDLPGFGGSPLAKDTGFSLADYCAVIRSVFDKMDVGRAVLIGHSLGGRIAIKFAALHPDRVERMALISAAGIPARSFRLTLLRIGRGLFKTVFFAARDFKYILRLKNLLGAIFGSKDYQTARGALYETLKKVLAEDLRDDAKKISIPTLLVWGKNDQITPPRDAAEYHALIKGSRLEMLDGGHFAFLEYPAQCASIIVSFLRKDA